MGCPVSIDFVTIWEPLFVFGRFSAGRLEEEEIGLGSDLKGLTVLL